MKSTADFILAKKCLHPLVNISTLCLSVLGTFLMSTHWKHIGVFVGNFWCHCWELTNVFLGKLLVNYWRLCSQLIIICVGNLLGTY